MPFKELLRQLFHAINTEYCIGLNTVFLLLLLLFLLTEMSRLNNSRHSHNELLGTDMFWRIGFVCLIVGNGVL